MKTLSFADSFEVLCLQLADDGREDALLGGNLARTRAALRPFIVGEEFPSCYLEFPLQGDAFLDVTVLYNKVTPGTHIDSPAAEGTDAMLDWFASVPLDHHRICCGYEVDAHKNPLPKAAIHFQPRTNIELVRPFCEAVGEVERAELYLDLARRMPQGWPLSFFGMFRGRPNSPLRVCGYLDADQKDACASDPQQLAQTFEEIGFTAYDDRMLSRVSTLMDIAPDVVDFQFDIFPDGSIGSTFAIDIQFGIERPALVKKSFDQGPASHVVGQLEQWGAADERWHLAADATFARALPIELDDGSYRRYAFTLMPHWIKARWTDGALQPSKLYCLAHAGLLDNKSEEQS